MMSEINQPVFNENIPDEEIIRESGGWPDREEKQAPAQESVQSN